MAIEGSKAMKYVVVTGGVVSGLGKGITISSIGRLLKLAGLRVTAIKIDPYLNTDAGTMSPFEHGEVFVLDDGGEADLDLGNYERFLDITLTADHNITTGKAYSRVMAKERKGDYLGKTVQIVPHVTDEIQSWIETVARRTVDGSSCQPDVCLIEVGGTVGDIESMVFLEALRQFQFRVGLDNIVFVHVSLVPVVGAVGEQKTKPTQHSVKELRSLGLSPHLLVCRSSAPLNQSTTEKLSVFCQVGADMVVSVWDVPNIYHVPLLLADQGVPQKLMDKLHISMRIRCGPRGAWPQLKPWEELAQAVDNLEGGCAQVVRIALVGKYTGLQDSYLSVLKALKHSAIQLNRKLEVVWIEASCLEPKMREEDESKHSQAWTDLRSVDGILVPGGFGSRGVEGKILAAQYAREAKVPFLGVCLGMQVMVIEAARHLLGWADANSQEFNESSSQLVIIFMPEINKDAMGGTMRLGVRPTLLTHILEDDSKTLASDLYGDVSYVNERHRHRYEVNPAIVHQFEATGFRFTGKDDQGQRMEILELPRTEHPFYLGTQFHPEFKSRPRRPSPPFFGLVAVASKQPEHISEAAPLFNWGRGSPPPTSIEPCDVDTVTTSPSGILDTSPASVAHSPPKRKPQLVHSEAHGKQHEKRPKREGLASSNTLAANVVDE